MSRAHCLDCGTDVPVDPLGHCPEGHLLPAQGRRVESAIGSDDHHPDEPEPWVGQVDPPEAEAPEDVVPSAQPQTAPGLAPAQPETSTGDLLRELGSLHTPDDPPASTPGHADPPAAPDATAEPTSPAPSVTPPPAASSPSTGNAVSEQSALEQALQSLEDSHAVPAAPEPAKQPSPAPALDDDLSSLFDELDGLGAGESNGSSPAAHDAPPTAPPPTAAPSQPPTAPPPAPAPPPMDAPTSPPPGDEHAANGHHAAHDDTAPRGMDTMNFTAKGGAMNGRRRRRLLGR